MRVVPIAPLSLLIGHEKTAFELDPQREKNFLLRPFDGRSGLIEKVESIPHGSLLG
jgi:hypothetical protein